MAIKTYEDSFRAVFSEDEDLRDFLKQVETEEEWISVDRELSIRKNNPSESKDEIEKSSMFSICVNGEFRPLGETSIPGLQEAEGNGKILLKLLSDHSYERYVSNINEGLDIMDKKRKLLYRSGKIRNVVPLNYKSLPQRGGDIFL